MQVQKRLDKIELLAMQDEQYQNLLQENKLLEKRFDQMVRRLSDEERAIAWDFVMNCEDVSRRLLELACEV